MKFSASAKKVLFIALLVLCWFPFIEPPLALILGFAMTNTIGNPFEQQSSRWVKWLLKVAIVGLGFGMNFYSAVEAGKDGLLFTMATIALVFAGGLLLGRLFKSDFNISYLITSGTAICGGSAIAAVAPIIRADQKQISVSLGTVFVLNAVALMVFPSIGHYFALSQQQFGIWSAIAIHDTSSVVGAASAYGPEALQTATTIKLARALWIIPLSLLTVLIAGKGKSKLYLPYFIALFVVAMLINTFLPQGAPLYSWLVFFARKALVVTLFLIGSGLSMSVIRAVGPKTLLQGTILWLFISAASLTAIILRY